MNKSVSTTIFLFAIHLFISESLYAQRNILKYAAIEFKQNRFQHAGSQYEEAYRLKKSYFAARRAAESFSAIKSYEKAFEWWGNTLEFKEAQREDYMNYAMAAVQSGRNWEDLDIDLLEAETQRLVSILAISEDENVEFRPLQIYNGFGSDYGLRKDNSGISYFISDREISKPSQKKALRWDAANRFSASEVDLTNDRGYHRIFQNRNNEISQIAIEMEGRYHVSMPAFYKVGDVQEVIFTAVLKDNSNNKETSLRLYPGLYRAEVANDGSFVNVSPLPYNNPDKHAVMHAFVTGNSLYFSSDMPGGYGGFDLYYAEFNGKDFGPAVNLGTKINSLENDVFPFFQENTLYFSSDRPGGLGGLDIFKIRDSLDAQVENMGKPYNSSQDDFSYFIDANGQQYLSSDRSMSQSKDNIYFLASLVDTYRLRVFSEAGERLDAMADLVTKIRAADQREIPTQLADGRVVSLKVGSYSLAIEKKGFFPLGDSLEVLTPEGIEKIIDFTMVAIPFEKQLTLDSINYDLDKFVIRYDASKKLDRVAELLAAYPEFDLTITSHTDARASYAYNEQLSEARSLSAMNYLINRGVPSDRIKTDWKGKTQLIEPCLTDDDCRDDLHEINRRSILTLVLYPDRDRNYRLSPGLEGIKDGEELFRKIPQLLQ